MERVTILTTSADLSTGKPFIGVDVMITDLPLLILRERKYRNSPDTAVLYKHDEAVKGLLRFIWIYIMA